MHLRLLFSALLFSFFAQAQSQVVSTQLIESYSIQDLETMVSDLGAGGLINPQYSVDFYRVLYYTEYNDSMTLVSGALALPQGMDCKAALVSYQHGTTSSKEGVPSYQSGEGELCAIFASLGKVVVAPDHIGLGSSPVDIHPYVHGYSQAHSTINLLRAARNLQTDLNFELGNQLFLFGYSQGGYSTAVTVRYIEEVYSDEFQVTMAAPMSGPYNVAGVQTDYINSGIPYATPGYLPYIVLGYQSVYHNLYDSLSEIFIAPYDTLLPDLFYGHNYSMGYINSQCDPVPIDMMQPDQIQEFNTNPNHPLRVALQEQDLLDWVPQSPMKMYYCTNDEQVQYRNAQIADSVWTLNGAPNVEAIDLGFEDHSGCLFPALTSGLLLFSGLDNNGIEILLTYDESSNQFTVDVLNEDINDYNIMWNNGSTATTLGDLQDGIPYNVTLTHKTTGCEQSRNSFTIMSVGLNDIADVAIAVYPNPASKILNIDFETSRPYDITIIDIVGKEVFSANKNYTKQVAIDISTLSSGVYSVLINGESKVVKQFVKK